MTINLQKPDLTELKPRITVYGVGGGGGNAVNNMISGGLEGVEFVVANTDAQALSTSKAERIVQMGIDVTEGLGAGSRPEVGRAAAEECLAEITDHLSGTHMAFVTAGMGGGTGTGAAPVVARVAREMGILTVGVVTKPFDFEGQRRMRTAEKGIEELQQNVDTLIVIPNQNLFRIANDKTTFAEAFSMADQVLNSGVSCITDLMVKEGLINLDFADVRSVMNEMGKAMMGTGEASGDKRSIQAAEAAISNPLLDESSMSGAKGLLISITGGRDMTLFEVDEAATRIREEVDADANIILGATFDENLEGTIRVSVVATGIDNSTATEEGNQDKMHNNVSSSAPGIIKTAEIDVAVHKIKTASVEKSGVRIMPFQPQGSAFVNTESDAEFRDALEEELELKERHFIPPLAESSDEMVAMPEIPTIGGSSHFAKAEDQAREEAPVSSADDRGAMGLLRKLKSGFGVQEEAKSTVPARMSSLQHDSRKEVVESEMKPSFRAERDIPLEVPESSAKMRNTSVASNAYNSQKSVFSANEKIIVNQKHSREDDQLEIPAFLRRQVN